jgi:predicted lipoprotein
VLRDAWADAYEAWQYANAYNFGPAGEEGLRKGLVEEIGTFPANESKIQSVLSAGTWNLNDFNRDARGFLAIEYLIFGKNKTAQEIVDDFANSATRRNYLLALVVDVKNRVGEVRNAWRDSYRESFVQNAGTDVGSSASQLYNEFVRSYESIKNFKLGLPLGKRPGQTQAEPQLFEAYYSGQSLLFLKAHVAAIEDIWRGRARDGQDGVGFQEYLESVEGGKDLVASTESQLAALKTALNAVPVSPSLAEQITGGQTQVDALYVEFSKMTRFFKSDMSSLLGIAITFSSGDGD